MVDRKVEELRLHSIYISLLIDILSTLPTIWMQSKCNPTIGLHLDYMFQEGFGLLSCPKPYKKGVGWDIILSEAKQPWFWQHSACALAWHIHWCCNFGSVLMNHPALFCRVLPYSLKKSSVVGLLPSLIAMVVETFGAFG